jgi:hypothetical protein
LMVGFIIPTLCVLWPTSSRDTEQTWNFA